MPHSNALDMHHASCISPGSCTAGLSRQRTSPRSESLIIDADKQRAAVRVGFPPSETQTTGRSKATETIEISLLLSLEIANRQNEAGDQINGKKSQQKGEEKDTINVLSNSKEI